METSIIQIGNSQGIRIPKPILEQCGFKERVELEVQSDQLIIRPIREVRQSWAKAFEEMAKNGDDRIF
jgi:antitoxin MazE